MKADFERLPFKVLADQGESIGAIAVLDQSHVLIICFLAILPTHQHRGLGTHLLQPILTQATQAHPKRVNFDLHKVAGMITVAFLAIIAFTGVCWNLPALTDPVIHAVMLSSKHIEPVSKPIAGKTSLPLSETFLAKADTALPGERITYLSLPTKANEIFSVTKHFLGDWSEWGDHKVYFDQYSGEVVKIGTHRTQSAAERFTNTFSALHYGYFGGLPTRIFYFFVGLAPTFLLITGFAMWRYRKLAKSVEPEQTLVRLP
jgi:uncharacterized iron-regulated membrane protein